MEEKLSVDLPDQVITITIEGRDVEAALPYLSGGNVNWTQADRLSATFEFVVAQNPEKPASPRVAKPRVTVVSGYRINYDPRHDELIHPFLKKWGIES